MKIGIIGAGLIGHTAAQLFVKAGYDVALSNSRGPESLREAVAQLGRNAQAATVDGAANFGDVVLLAVPWRSPEALPSLDIVKGKIVIDAMNAYTPTGGQFDLGDSTSSEETAQRLPGIRIVKAFNTIWYKHLATQGNVALPEAERRVILLASDDEEAKAIVADLIRAIGFAPVDTGNLREGGRRQQPGSHLYNQSLTGEQAVQALASE